MKPNETRRLRRSRCVYSRRQRHQRNNAYKVHRTKGPGVRSRIVAKATRSRSRTKTPSTPRTLLALRMSRPNWIAPLGDVSTAFLHAPVPQDHDGKQRYVYLWPSKELCPLQNKLWRLKKAMCGLRSSPKAWQDYLAEVLQKLSFVRLKSEPNVYTNASRDCYIMVYVDDLLVLGDKTTVDSIFEAIQKQVLLKHIGYLEPGLTIPGKKHRALRQLLRSWTSGRLHRQHE